MIEELYYLLSYSGLAMILVFLFLFVGVLLEAGQRILEWIFPEGGRRTR